MLRNLRYALNTTTPEALVPTIHYELTNHLGNVMAVITDEPTDAETPAVESLTDYYPFGMTMPGRSYNAHTSRHGFTGHEKESDLAEGIYTTEYRLYDARVGRWLSVDPLFEKYVGMSSYNYCMLNPLVMVDPDGKRTFNIVGEDGVSEMIEDGVDETVDMHRDDFTVLKNTFESDNTEEKIKYNSYFNAFTTRPSYNKMQEEYPSGTPDEAYTKIGGKVEYNFKNIRIFENTCAIRMSRSLNYSGVKINFKPKKNGQSITGSGKDDNWYFYKVVDLTEFIVSRFGNPEFEGTYDELQRLGLKGIVQFSDCGFTNATGHFDLYDGNKCYNHCYGDDCNKVKLWLLPR